MSTASVLQFSVILNFTQIFQQQKEYQEDLKFTWEVMDMLACSMNSNFYLLCYKPSLPSNYGKWSLQQFYYKSFQRKMCNPYLYNEKKILGKKAERCVLGGAMSQVGSMDL